MTDLSLSLPYQQQIKTRYWFSLLLAFELGFSWFYQTRILTMDAYQTIYGERLDGQRIEELFDLMKQVRIWGYGMIPLILSIRLVFVALLIQMPLVFRFIDIPFREIFRIVTIASLAFAALEFVRLCHLAALPAVRLTLQQLNYVPFSVSFWLCSVNDSPGASAFFNHFNLFEIAFLIMIYGGLQRTKKLAKRDAALVVFLLWVVLIAMHWVVVIYLSRLSD
jgi:hypothetical protein